MSTSQYIDLSGDGGKIKFEIKSEPTPPVIEYSHSSWLSDYEKSNDGFTLSFEKNTGSTNNSGYITVSATTTTNTEYNGIASAVSSYTVTQNPKYRKMTIKVKNLSIVRQGFLQNNLTISSIYYMINADEFGLGAMLQDTNIPSTRNVTNFQPTNSLVLETYVPCISFSQKFEITMDWGFDGSYMKNAEIVNDNGFFSNKIFGNYNLLSGAYGLMDIPAGENDIEIDAPTCTLLLTF